MTSCSKQHQNPDSNSFCQQCGELLPLATGQIIDNRYRLVKELGQGGGGRTYLAEHINAFNDKCVIKEFAPQVQNNEQLIKTKELFEREANVLYKLNHPQIPKFRETIQAHINGKAYLFLVQDYIEGTSYFNLVNQGKKFSESEIRQLLLQILEILKYIHAQNLVHRDISPDNLMCRNGDNLPVLIDFGAVKDLGTANQLQFNKVRNTATKLGKPVYAPKEQLEGKEVKPNMDLYALAVTVLVLFTRQDPTNLYDIQNATWKFNNISITPQLKTVLEKMLDHSPLHRYQSATEVIDAINLPHLNPILSGIKTILVSPGIPKVNPIVSRIKTIFTSSIAANPSHPSHPSQPNNYVNNQNPPQINISPAIHWLWLRRVGITMISMGLVILTGMGTLAIVNSLIHSQSSKSEKFGKISDTEKNRKSQILSRQKSLKISDKLFNTEVNKLFYAKHPELNQRPLTSDPKDAKLRDEWYQIAEDWLNTK